MTGLSTTLEISLAGSEGLERRQNEIASVTVFGLGYVGLPTAALIASSGISVLGVDNQSAVVDRIASGLVQSREPGLQELIRSVIASGRLRVSTTPGESDAFIIAVPTPIAADRSPDLSSLFSVCDAMASHLKQNSLVLLESTVPVGTTHEMSRRLACLRDDLKFPTEWGERADVCIAYCPERVLPGQILGEAVDNARCIGGITPRCARRAQQFYERFVRGTCVVTTARTAEMVKLAENAFRDVNIAFANELATICDQQSIDAWDVIALANQHPRVGILKPGPGVGGHCIAVDPWFIVHSAPDQARLIRTAREVNDGRIAATVERVAALMNGDPDVKVACLGLTFKANVDDLRESPALEVTIRLARHFPGRIVAVEPFIEALPAALQELDVPLMSIQDALTACDVAVVLVDHDDFRRVPAGDRRHLSVIDTRGIWREPQHGA